MQLQHRYAVVILCAYGFNTDRPSAKYWCWLGQNFKAERIAGEYIWFWLTLFVSITLYLPLFLLHHGIIQEGSAWYAPRIETGRDDPDRDRVKSKVFSRKPAKLWTAIL